MLAKSFVVRDRSYTLASGRQYYVVLVRFEHEQHISSEQLAPQQH